MNDERKTTRAADSFASMSPIQGITSAPWLNILNTAEQITRFREQLETSGALQAVDHYLEVVRPALERIRALNLPDIERLHQATKALKRFEQTVKPRLDRAGRRLAKIGWVGLENHLSEEAYFELAELVASKGGDAVDRRLVRELRANRHRVLHSITREWWGVPALQRRRRIAREALWAHRQGRYALSVPTLFPLVDAVAADIEAVPRAHGTRHVKKAAHRDADGPTSPLVFAVEHVFFKTHGRNAAPHSTLNRHDVLHGRAIGYASEVTSCKVIMLLDALAHVALAARESIGVSSNAR